MVLRPFASHFVQVAKLLYGYAAWRTASARGSPDGLRCDVTGALVGLLFAVGFLRKGFVELPKTVVPPEKLPPLL
jgi:hypothetical protein